MSNIGLIEPGMVACTKDGFSDNSTISTVNRVLVFYWKSKSRPVWNTPVSCEQPTWTILHFIQDDPHDETTCSGTSQAYEGHVS